MKRPAQTGVKLPRQLLNELGVSGENFSQKRRNGGPKRKELRKAAKVQKKTSQPVKCRPRITRERSRSPNDEPRAPSTLVAVPRTQERVASAPPKALKSILKTPTKRSPIAKRQDSPPPPVKLSRGVRNKIAEDDAEIATLQKKLGIKSSNKLPKSFAEDGLDTLLQGIDEAVGLEARPAKRKASEVQQWLENKRQERSEEGLVEVIESEVDSDGESDVNGDDEADFEGFIENSDDELNSMASDHSDGTKSIEGEAEKPLPTSRAKMNRENPYVAPIVDRNYSLQQKYIAPSFREKGASSSEDLTQLRRQMQGLLNRLSEANLVSILGGIETLYQKHPRQHVSTSLLDLLMGLLSDPTSLNDTFIILHAGFIAAVYKVLGTDFGAQAIQRIDDELSSYYSTPGQAVSGKNLTNLTSLLTELYKFQVIGSNLIFDFVRLFLENLSETNTELLLKIIRNAGPQLRQDDPSALKDIVLQLQNAAAGAGEDNLSVRTRFMIETMNNLKNNRMKTGIAASTVTSEHTVRMKKILGTLNHRSLRASEPLRIGIKDLRDSEKKCKWWLVGASNRDDSEVNFEHRNESDAVRSNNGNPLTIESVSVDLAQLAREQRMNTDVRRSIFIAILSATDVNDAYVRLTKLGLKKSQELEIPKVLIHCAGSERNYNPFYTFISRRFCSDRKLKMAFQFSLWDLFKHMGEGNDEVDGDNDEDAENKLSLRNIVNLARLFGTLIADKGLGLGVLKVCPLRKLL